MNNNSMIESRLKDLGVELPETRKPMASYLPAVTVDRMVYVSGQGCNVDGKFLYTGKVGKELSVEQGQKAARQCVINGLSVLRNEIGNLDSIKRIVKLLGFVNCTPDFNEQPFVINGASDFLEAVFHENGRHARSAIGASNLPFDIPVEIEFIVELKS